MPEKCVFQAIIFCNLPLHKIELKKITYIFVFIFAFLVANFELFAQQWSIPYLKNYSPKLYEGGTDNWSVVQDKRGVMFFANAIGVLEYDGTRWRMYSVSNQSMTRSLAIDSKGRVYVGAVGEFGYLEADGKGELHYKSLTEKLSEADKAFSDVWKIYVLNDEIYFQSFEKIFCLKDGTIKVYNPQNLFHLSYVINNELWVIDRGIGLKRIENGNLIDAPSSSFFADEKIYAAVPFDSKTWLISTRNKGLQLYKPFAKNSEQMLSPFNTPASVYLEESAIYQGIEIDNNTIAFATLGGGVVVLEKNGRVKNIFNKLNGLQDDNVYFMFLDSHKSLWLALDNGISKLEITSPLSWFNDISGVSGSVESIIYFQNKLYVATTQGVFIQNSVKEDAEIKSKEDVLKRVKRFSQIPGISSQSWSLVKIKESGEDKLLIAGTSDGVYEISGEKSKLISSYYTYSIYQSTKNPDIFYLGTVSGLAVLKREGNKWKDLGVLEGIQSSIRSIVEDKNGDVWMGIPFFEGVAKIEFKKEANYNTDWGASYNVQTFDTTSGLNDFRYNIVYGLNDEILIGTYKGLFKWDFDKQKFFPEKRFGDIFSDGSRQVFCFTKGPENTYWFFNTNDKMRETGVVTLSNKQQQWHTTTFKRFSENEIHSIYITPDKRVWFGGPDGLIVYNSKVKKDYNKPFYNIISKVVVGKDSILFYGNFKREENATASLLVQGEDDIPSLSYNLNSLVFEFSSVSFEEEKNNKYKWFLEGYDNEWTNWTNESKVSYTNLPEGKYTFRLISKNTFENESEETVYSFVILPPWYRTVYAYIAYVLIFVGFVYGAIQLSIYRLKRSKAQLELVVQERTAEIVQQKEEIEIQKELVEEKNKDITDSINYASRIQQAILPIMDEIKKVLPESFVFYRPRDIVSGDFYWFVKKGKDVYIAAADCTGHGVPGAFMSMIGHTLLNEILNQKNITSTGEILTELHKQIRISLKQDQQESRDGMDIALCKLNIETLMLEYSGAMRPLYLIIDGELSEVKADKFPIGGLQDNDEKRMFKSNEIQLKKGDLFYIFSDGYADQFGGKDGKKFMVKRLKELLLNVAPHSMSHQYNEVVNAYLEWLGDGEQIDDILFVGVRA